MRTRNAGFTCLRQGFGGRQSRRQGGFTLVEILIAMVVLVVGLVGILVLFPVGLKNVGYAQGDTTAANLAASVHSALVAAHRMVVLPPPGSPPGTRSKVKVVHDLVSSKALAAPKTSVPGQYYEFELPLEADGGTTEYCCHPAPDPGAGQVVAFTLGTDPWVNAAIKDIKVTDVTESYRQYAFKFNVRKVPTIPVGGNSNLYEYNIIVFRVLGTQMDESSGTGVVNQPPPIIPGVLTIGTGANTVAILSARISGP